VDVTGTASLPSVVRGENQRKDLTGSGYIELKDGARAVKNDDEVITRFVQ
jgi:hypothetical protein